MLTIAVATVLLGNLCNVFSSARLTVAGKEILAGFAAVQGRSKESRIILIRQVLI
jgi:hypothetical protein